MHKNENIYFLDKFSFELVKERLNVYDVFSKSNKLALTNIIIILYIHLTELETLCIINNKVINYKKTKAKEIFFKYLDQ